MSATVEAGLVKTLTRHGNSLALVLDKPILEMLGITAETPLQITTDGKSLIIAPANADRHKKFLAAADETFRRYPKMLKRLAE